MERRPSFLLLIIIFLLGIIIIFLSIIWWLKLSSNQTRINKSSQEQSQMVPNQTDISSFVHDIQKITFNDGKIYYKFSGTVTRKVYKENDLFYFEVKVTNRDGKSIPLKFITPGILEVSLYKGEDQSKNVMLGVFDQLEKPAPNISEKDYLKEVDKEIIEGRSITATTKFYPEDYLAKLDSSNCCSDRYKKLFNLLANPVYLEQADKLFTEYKNNQIKTAQIIELPVSRVDILTE